MDTGQVEQRHRKPVARRTNLARAPFFVAALAALLGAAAQSAEAANVTAMKEGVTTFTYSNPLAFSYEALGAARRELRDPCIIRQADTYYLVFTVWPFSNRQANRLDRPNQGGSPGIKLYSSKDLKSWRFENWLVKSSELPKDCPYKNRFWAPEIHKIAGRFYLIFTADNWLRNEYNPAGGWGTAGYAFVGVADDITGPYRHITYINGGACDTSLFEDADGETYAIIPAYNVYVQQIDLSRIDRGQVGLVGPRIQAVSAKNDDIGFAAEPDYLEGPWMIQSRGKYVIFYAGPYREQKNKPEHRGYWVGAAYADNPLGPWKKDKRGQIFWGGHIAVFNGPDGRNWFSYRNENDNKTRGLLCIDPVDIEENGTVRPHGPSLGEQAVPILR
ncbi:MAG: family 43 glycosylhydrolase [Sedimentisphaerales bacterium]|nr:family 43 glycosylhydrolase [Sedimentisphaerales bacterium]